MECALTVIGKAYELGRGIEQDEFKAFETYSKAMTICKNSNSKCSCSNGLIAHCYYKGIGVEKNEEMAYDIIKTTVDALGNNSHDYVALLYSYFALNNIEGFDLITSLTLFENIENYSHNIYIIMILKRIYKRLGKHNDVRRMAKMEKKALENTGELNLNYVRKYIKNFNDFYPILNRDFTL